jgi:hypothetical protein
MSVKRVFQKEEEEEKNGGGLPFDWMDSRETRGFVYVAHTQIQNKKWLRGCRFNQIAKKKRKERQKAPRLRGEQKKKKSKEVSWSCHLLKAIFDL